MVMNGYEWWMIMNDEWQIASLWWWMPWSSFCCGCRSPSSHWYVMYTEKEWHIANYYELLPVSVTTMIFDHCVQHLMYDNQVEVREYCLRVWLSIWLSILNKEKKEWKFTVITITIPIIIFDIYPIHYDTLQFNTSIHFSHNSLFLSVGSHRNPRQSSRLLSALPSYILSLVFLIRSKSSSSPCLPADAGEVTKHQVIRYEPIFGTRWFSADDGVWPTV